MNKRIILGLATIATGLSAGVFYTFSTAINPALAKLSDQNYIAAMQNINRDIQNPLFFASFFGAAIFLPWAVYLYRNQKASIVFKALVVSSVLYIVGVFGVTSAANVPLNDALDKVPVATASAQELETARTDYIEPWNQWHTVRTISSIAAFTAVTVALLAVRSNKNNGEK